MTVWDYEPLWQKTKLFAAKAFEEVDRESDEFGLWASFALESLARATLAFVHPALLADPQAGGNLLYAFGYSATEAPKSVQAKTVLERCKFIVPGFTENDAKRCQALLERRNSELHSGELAFGNYKTNLWLADFFRICELLLASQQKHLTDLLGPDEAAAASTMITASQAAVEKTVKTRIAAHRLAFAALGEGERIALRDAVPKIVESPKRMVSCPACDSRAVISGDVFKVSDAKMQDEMIFRELFVLPSTLRCSACGLALTTHDELHAAGVGGQYSVTKVEDPADFYGMVYMEPDYGND